MTLSFTSIMTLSEMVSVKGVTRALINLLRALKHRREIIQLADFDDHMLKDIGLTRGDVEGALAEPLVHNPSLVLVRCAERHSRAEKLVPPVLKARPVVPVVTRERSWA
jgi:uncharacterized protein YjiS (DUF1127 family)